MSSAPLLAATLSTGLVAGLLTGFGAAVMPGLAQADDATFIGVMADINERIINPVALSMFLGSLAWPVVVLVLGDRPPGESQGGDGTTPGPSCRSARSPAWRGPCT